MYELNEIDGMVEGIFMVMEEHGVKCEDGHWLTEEELLSLPEKKQSILEAEIMRIMEKSLKTALDLALDDILKDFK